MTIPSNLNFELLGVLVLLLLTPALMVTRTLRVSVFPNPKMSRLDAAWTAVLVIVLHEFVWLFFIV